MSYPLLHLMKRKKIINKEICTKESIYLKIMVSIFSSKHLCLYGFKKCVFKRVSLCNLKYATQNTRYVLWKSCQAMNKGVLFIYLYCICNKEAWLLPGNFLSRFLHFWRIYWKYKNQILILISWMIVLTFVFTYITQDIKFWL